MIWSEADLSSFVFFKPWMCGSEEFSGYLVQINATAIHAKAPVVYPPMLLYH